MRLCTSSLSHAYQVSLPESDAVSANTYFSPSPTVSLTWMFFLDALWDFLTCLIPSMKEKKKIFSFSFQSIINNKKLTENTFSCPGVNSSHTQLVLLLLQKEVTSLKGTALFNDNNCRIVWEMLRNENTLHHVEILLFCWYYVGTVFSGELFYLRKRHFLTRSMSAIMVTNRDRASVEYIHRNTKVCTQHFWDQMHSEAYCSYRRHAAEVTHRGYTVYPSFIRAICFQSAGMA